MPFTASVGKVGVAQSVTIGDSGVTVCGTVEETQLLKNTAKAVIAKYSVGILQSVEIKDIPTVINDESEFSFTASKDGTDKIGVTVLDSLTSMRLCVKCCVSNI